MTKSNVIGIFLAAVFAFLGSSLWYSPLLLGRQFLALSGMTGSATSDQWKIAAEMLRNLLLASVICWLLAGLGANSLKSALRLAAILWLGFPFTLLSGSVLWQNVPVELGLIHSGDWLLKLFLMTTTFWLVNRKAAVVLHQRAIGAVQPN